MVFLKTLEFRNSKLDWNGQNNFMQMASLHLKMLKY